MLAAISAYFWALYSFRASSSNWLWMRLRLFLVFDTKDGYIFPESKNYCILQYLELGYYYTCKTRNTFLLNMSVTKHARMMVGQHERKAHMLSFYGQLLTPDTR